MEDNLAVEEEGNFLDYSHHQEHLDIAVVDIAAVDIADEEYVEVCIAVADMDST